MVETRPIPAGKPDTVQCDQVIQLTSDTARQACPYRLRRVIVCDPVTEQTVVLLTNHEGLAADTIGQIYRDR